jgi:hypothetical protein
MTMTTSIIRKPFTPLACLLSPGDNLISAVALNYELPYSFVANIFRTDHLEKDEPGLDTGALASGTSLQRRALSREAARVLGPLNAAQGLPDNVRPRIETLLGAAFGLARAKSPGVHAGSMAMALEEVMLAVAWPRDHAVQVASLVARMTDCAIAEAKLARYTGYSADVATHLRAEPGFNLGFLVRLGVLPPSDPRLNVPLEFLEPLRSTTLDHLTVELRFRDLSSDPGLLELPGSPYSHRALRRLEMKCSSALSHGVVFNSEEGAAFMRALGCLAEGCAMNLAHARADDDKVFDLLAKSHRMLAYRCEVVEQLRKENGERDREVGDGVTPAGTDFLRACRAAPPYV